MRTPDQIKTPAGRLALGDAVVEKGIDRKYSSKLGTTIDLSRKFRPPVCCCICGAHLGKPGDGLTACVACNAWSDMLDRISYRSALPPSIGRP